MQFVILSDTHGRHRDVLLPETADGIIHAGDFTMNGTEAEVDDFLIWLSNVPYEHKIVIAGNHDFYLDGILDNELANKIPNSIRYLNDSGCQINGINFWGTPVQPTFSNWAFNRDEGKDLIKHWNLIPPETQVLITHGPPLGILDTSSRGVQLGSPSLLNTVRALQPDYHVFGHIHEGYGTLKQNQTVFVNASVLNVNYQLTNRPILISIA